MQNFGAALSPVPTEIIIIIYVLFLFATSTEITWGEKMGTNHLYMLEKPFANPLVALCKCTGNARS